MKRYLLRALIVIMSVCILISFTVVGCKSEATNGETTTSESATVAATTESSSATTTAAENAGEKVKIVMWQGNDNTYQDSYTQLASEYMAENPNITIEVNMIPSSEYMTNLLAAFVANNEPDIIDGFMDNALECEIKYETWLDLNPYVQDWEEYKKLPESAIKALTLRGKLYGFLSYDLPVALLVRTSWLKNVGWEKPYPYLEDWNDLTELAKLFTFNDPNKNGKNDTWGFEFFGSLFRDYAALQLEYLAAAADGSQFIKDDKMNITSDTMVRAVQFMQDCVFKDKVSPLDTSTYTYVELYRDIKAGNVGIARLGGWNLPSFDEALGADEYIAIPFPPIDKGKTAYHYSEYQAWCIAKTTKHPEEVVAWMKYLESEHAAEVLYKATGMVSFIKDFPWDQWATTANQKFFVERKFEEIYQVADPRWSTEQKAILATHVQNCLLNSTTDPATELQAAYDEIAPGFNGTQ